MKTITTAFLLSLFVISSAFADSLLLVSGGKISGSITGQTSEHYIVSSEGKQLKIDKTNVVYLMNSIEIQNPESVKKASLMPYVYPYEKSFELGICLIF